MPSIGFKCLRVGRTEWKTVKQLCKTCTVEEKIEEKRNGVHFQVGMLQSHIISVQVNTSNVSPLRGFGTTMSYWQFFENLPDLCLWSWQVTHMAIG